MQTIYKYPLPIADDFTVALPTGAITLCVQTQAGGPCIWALVDPAKPLEARRFLMRGTGHPANGIEASRYVGTFQMRDGDLVFHLFEVTP